MRARWMINLPVLVGSTLLLVAAGDKVPQDVLDRPDFYAKMEMIENISAIESLNDQDMRIVMNTSAPLPKTAKLEEGAADKPEDQAEGQ